MPVNSRTIQAEEAAKEDGERKLTVLEKAVFLEADALQYEMGSIVSKVGASGNVLFDTTSNSYHKDRVSSMAMGLDYICEIEKENMERFKRGTPCVGVAS